MGWGVRAVVLEGRGWSPLRSSWNLYNTWEHQLSKKKLHPRKFNSEEKTLKNGGTGRRSFRFLLASGNFSGPALDSNLPAAYGSSSHDPTSSPNVGGRRVFKLFKRVTFSLTIPKRSQTQRISRHVFWYMDQHFDLASLVSIGKPWFAIGKFHDRCQLLTWPHRVVSKNKKNKTAQSTSSSWWLNQPIGKILVKLDHLPREGWK